MNDLELLQRRIRVARGLEPGDLLLRGGQIVNVFTGQIESGNIVIADGWIAGVGPYDWQARDVIELDGRPVVPGLIDAHMHLESTLLWPPELARALVPHGTSAIIADPHEIANVLGIPGVEMMLAASEGLPLDLFFMAPSCVPATAWEDAGAVLDAAAVERLLQLPRVLGLAEVMDFPAVLDGREPVLAKLLAAQRRSAPVDGHAPGLRGQSLVAYVAAGIRADHESTEIDEALQKAALGMMVQVRQGSSEHNLETFLPLLVEDRLGDWSLATDDILPTDILERGHINALLRRTVEAGVPPARAVRHATLVPARHYGLRNRGAVAPGYRADVVVMNDLRTFQPTLVVHGGQIVARDGRCVWEGTPSSLTPENTVRDRSPDRGRFGTENGGQGLSDRPPRAGTNCHATPDRGCADERRTLVLCAGSRSGLGRLHRTPSRHRQNRPGPGPRFFICAATARWARPSRTIRTT